MTVTMNVRRRSSRRRRMTASTTTIGLLCLSGLSLAQTNPFDCSSVTVDVSGAKVSYNLSSIAGVKELSRSRETPPSTFVDELRFDLCANVPKKEGVADGDQCPSETRACLTVTNKKDSSDRITSVVQLAASDSLNPELKALSNPDGLSIIFHGASYPKTDPKPQSFNVTLICDSSKTTSSPEFKSYDDTSASIEWATAAACRVQQNPPDNGSDGKDGDKSEENVGNGIGWFFLLFMLAFIAYFALGAYYNYSTYGATGLDLIPHRDFWRDVPYIIRDVVSHLCSTVRPKRGGYIAV